MPPKRITPDARAIQDRFWAKVAKSESCWLWTASVARRGYGQFVMGRPPRKVSAHRFSWMIHFGPIPEGMNICHTCDNPGCVRPDHLFLGTSRENVDDMMRKHRQVAGSRNGQARLTEDDVRQIRALHAIGVMQKDLACQFGVSTVAICQIVGRKRWRHVN